jgi:CHAD domain-containing protein
VAEQAAALELTLHPDDADRLPRVADLLRLRAGRARATPLELTWYDTPDGALAEAGLSLCERRAGRETAWRLERLRGTPETPWPPGTPAPLVAEAKLPAGLPDLPAPLLPVAACAGTVRSFPLVAEAAPLAVTLLDGVLRAVAGERPVCRLTLAGPPDAVEPLLVALAATLRLSVPAAALAAEARAVAGRTTPPHASGPPELPADLSVADAFVRVVGHLAAVLLHWAPLAAGDSAEPVHQMRVALRRLRSASSLFRRAVGGPELDAINAELGALAHMLAPARDWDVFAAGTGRAVGAGFPHERAVARLLAVAERRRLAAYAALRAHLDGPAFRLLGLRLACLVAFRPWQREAPADAAADDATAKQAALRAAPLAGFAAHALARRLERMLAAGDDLSSLPVEALHAIRIQGKRLRYAAELFAPLYPRKETRRFLRRIAALQERLGRLNDGAVAEALMAQLGGGGKERAMAIGIVRGFVAAGMRPARAKSERSWRKLRRLEPFWA